jgi:hypothetical protein
MRSKHRNTDARGNPHGLALERDLGNEALDAPPANEFDIGNVKRFRKRIANSSPPSRETESEPRQRVTGIMPLRIVHLLEPAWIDEQREAAALAPCQR